MKSDGLVRGSAILGTCFSFFSRVLNSIDLRFNRVLTKLVLWDNTKGVKRDAVSGRVGFELK